MDKILNEKSLAFLEAVASGVNPRAAARAAGYANPKASSEQLMKNPQIHGLLNLLGKGGRKFKVTRDQVHEMVMEAYDIAKLQADAGSMVRAAAEVNRMNGFYEPERRKIELDITVREKQEALQELSDEELLELMTESTEDAIEGEFEEVEDAG